MGGRGLKKEEEGTGLRFKLKRLKWAPANGIKMKAFVCGRVSTSDF